MERRENRTETRIGDGGCGWNELKGVKTTFKMKRSVEAVHMTNSKGEISAEVVNYVWIQT